MNEQGAGRDKPRSKTGPGAAGGPGPAAPRQPASDLAIQGVGHLIAPWARHPPLALAAARSIGWGIRGEVLLRRLMRLQMNAGSQATGVETRAARLRQAERAEALSLRGLAAVPTPAHGGKHPLVNWHEGGTGDPLILLNGFTASGLSWPDVWVGQLEKSFRVIRVDNRGSGWSRAAPGPFTIADMADDVRDVLAAVGLDRVTVMGFSMGGMIAQEFAIRHPQHVERLALISTVPPNPAQVPATDYSAAIAMITKRAPREAMRGDARYREQIGANWLPFAAPGFAPAPEVLDEMGQQILRRVTPRPQALMQARAISSWSGPRRLRRIDAPCTVVHGASDPLVPVENGRRLSRLIPGARLDALPDVGHLVPWEAGDELLHVLGL